MTFPDAAPAVLPCVEGDARIETGDVCFLYFGQKATWADAQTACQNLGGDLATVSDSLHNGLIASIVPRDAKDVWFGATDVAIEGTWTWLDGEAFGAYTNWRAGEPNNSNDEDCGVIEVDNGGTWDDRQCSESYRYVCRR